MSTSATPSVFVSNRPPRSVKTGMGPAVRIAFAPPKSLFLRDQFAMVVGKGTPYNTTSSLKRRVGLVRGRSRIVGAITGVRVAHVSITESSDGLGLLAAGS